MHRLIIGKNTVLETLKRAPGRIIEVYTAHTSGDVLKALNRAGIRTKNASKQTLSQMAGSDSHQGYVARIKPLEEVNLTQFLKSPPEKSVVLLLDSIFDPHNFGAILRAAECFGVDLVIYGKNRGASITPTVSKTSAGATELVPTCCVSNLAETVKKMQDGGYWALATTLSPKSTSLFKFTFPERTLIVMGSEGKGVQQLIAKRCDHHVMIPMCGQIDSLNVSQATAVMLAAFRQCWPL